MAKLAAIISTFRTHALLGCCAAFMLAGCGGNDGAKREDGLVTQTAAEVLDSKTVAAAPVAGTQAADEPDVNAPAVPVEAEAVAEQAPVQAAPAPVEAAAPAAVELTAPAMGSDVAASGSARIFVAAGPGADLI